MGTLYPSPPQGSGSDVLLQVSKDFGPSLNQLYPSPAIFLRNMLTRDSQARPVKLESLAKKRLAVDASIWIYQVRLPPFNLTILVPQSGTRQRRASSPQFPHRRFLPQNL